MSARDGADFERLTQAWLTTFASPNTRAAYRSDLAAFGRWCTAQGAIALRSDAATIAAYQAAQEAAGRSAATRRRQWSSLTSFFQFAVDRDAAAVDPTRHGERPALPGAASPTAALSPAAVEAYLAAAAALDPRLDALVSLLVFDGLKLGEALALDVDDVRGRPPRLRVRVRRRGTVETVELAPRSARAVHRCAGNRAGEPLFTGARTGAVTRRLTRFGADHLLKKLSDDDGHDDGDGQPLTANALRRFHVTSHRASGADLETVRDRAGVDDVRTVRRYLAEETGDERGGRGGDEGTEDTEETGAAERP